MGRSGKARMYKRAEIEGELLDGTEVAVSRGDVADGFFHNERVGGD